MLESTLAKYVLRALLNDLDADLQEAVLATQARLPDVDRDDDVREALDELRLLRLWAAKEFPTVG
jgi:hypothetical protein